MSSIHKQWLIGVVGALVIMLLHFFLSESLLYYVGVGLVLIVFWIWRATDIFSYTYTWFFFETKEELESYISIYMDDLREDVDFWIHEDEMTSDKLVEVEEKKIWILEIRE